MKPPEDIQIWLRKRIAEEIKADPQAVSLSVPFAHYGLDSIVIVTLVGELEDWLGVSLDPTVFWEYPTIEALSEWLAQTDFSSR